MNTPNAFRFINHGFPLRRALCRAGLVLLTIALGVVPASAFWVTAYYPTWSGGAPADRNFTGLTHLIHFAASPTTTSPYIDTSALVAGNQAALLVARAHAQGVKVLMSVGGIWGTGADNMDYIAADATRAHMFVTTACTFARAQNYDGIEIDWEPPASEPEMTQLINLFRTELDRWTTLTPTGALALAVMDGSWDLYSTNAAVVAKVDQYNIMMYDMARLASGWCWSGCEQDVVGFNAPLHRPDAATYPILYKYQKNYDGVSTSPYTMQDAVVNGPNSWTAYGMPKGKIAPGLPLYGWFYGGIDRPGADMADVISSYYASLSRGVQVALTNGGVEHWYAASGVPWVGGTATGEFSEWGYVVSPGEKFYYTYDNADSIQMKVQWARNLGLGGVMLYDLASDYTTSPAAGESNQPLMAAAIEAATVADTKPPRFILEHSPAIFDDTQTISLTATAIDRSEIASLMLYLDGSAVKTVTNASVCAWIAGPFTAGSTHTFYATATDASPAANTGTSSNASLTATTTDTTAPTVAITSPTNGATIRNNITVQVAATDNAGVASVDLYLNGTLYRTLAETPYTFDVNTWSYSQGALVVRADAHDYKDNTGTATATLNVLNLPAATYTVFDDALNADWEEESWNQLGKIVSSPVHSGTNSYRFEPATTTWETLSLQKVEGDDLPSGAYTALDFWVNGGDASEALWICLTGSGSNHPYYQVATPVNEWGHVVIPLTVLAPDNDFISGIYFRSADGEPGNPFYVDDIKFTGGAPLITTQPAALTANPGASATFAVTVAGENLSYQWYKNGGAIMSATTTNYTIGSVSVADWGSYKVTVTNAAGSVTSDAALLTVNDPLALFVYGYGLDPASADGAATGDPDKDGLNNLEEFFFGGDPVHADSGLLPTAAYLRTNDPPVLALEFQQRAAAASIVWVIEYSTDLSHWTTVVNGTGGVTIATTPVNAGTNRITATFPATGSQLFIRLRFGP